jgi:uncharacterized protein (DUF3820 family)
MPWGMHQGKPMEDVPADYLIWLFDNGKVRGDVKHYIEENLDVLKMQIQNQKKGIK